MYSNARSSGHRAVKFLAQWHNLAIALVDTDLRSILASPMTTRQYGSSWVRQKRLRTLDVQLVDYTVMIVFFPSTSPSCMGGLKAFGYLALWWMRYWL